MLYYEDRKEKNFLWYIFVTLIYFIYLYSFIIPGSSQGTVVISLVLMIAYCFFLKLSSKKNISCIRKLYNTRLLLRYLFWTIFLLIYVGILLKIRQNTNGTSPISDYTNMLIILPIFFVTGNIIFSKLKELMTVLYIGGIIQAIIVLIAKFSPLITVLLISLFPENAYEQGGRNSIEQFIEQGYSIGIGVFTSAGCLRVAISQVGAFFFLVYSKGSKQWIHLLCFLLISFSNSLVARTGLLIALFGLICALYVMKKQGGGRLVRCILFSISIGFLGYLIINSFVSKNVIEDIFKRFIFLFENGVHDSYFRGYLGEGGVNIIPPLSIDTIIGLGITYGTSGAGIQTITDGGFLRNYSAMGLIVAILNYLLIFFVFRRNYLRLKSYETKGIVLFMFIIFLIGEFKEMFIYYTFSMCFIFLIFSLMERDNEKVSQNIHKCNSLLLKKS